MIPFRKRNKPHPRLRQKVDAEDVVQSAFRSYFVRHAKGEFEFANWGSLWGLLAQITLRKCGRQAENLHAAWRDIRRAAGPPTKLVLPHQLSKLAPVGR